MFGNQSCIPGIDSEGTSSYCSVIVIVSEYDTAKKNERQSGDKIVLLVIHDLSAADAFHDGIEECCSQ